MIEGLPKIPDTIDFRNGAGEVLLSKAPFIAFVTLLVASLFVGASFLLPRKFRTESQIAIYGKYFQNPLVRELIPDLYDSSELRLQREALVRQALDNTFIDTIGEKFGIYQSKPNSTARSEERTQLRKAFEIYPLNGTTFQVNFIGAFPELARDIGKAAMNQIIQTLVIQRRRTLENALDALRGRIESLALQLNHSADPMASARPELLKRELFKAEEEIRALLSRYTERHPRVAKLKSRAKWMRAWLGTSADENEVPPISPAKLGASPSTKDVVLTSASSREDPSERLVDDSPQTLVGGELEAPTREVYQELLKKMNYLSVALDMEQTERVSYYGILQAPELPAGAFAPKRMHFLLFGLTVGLLLGLLLAVLLEMRRLRDPKSITTHSS